MTPSNDTSAKASKLVAYKIKNTAMIEDDHGTKLREPKKKEEN